MAIKRINHQIKHRSETIMPLRPFLCVALVCFTACAAQRSFGSQGAVSSAALEVQQFNSSELEVVPFLDLERYHGTWYEIASFPKWFSRDCVNSQANYSVRTDGRVNVVNTCRVRTANGQVKTVEGVARVVDESSNAKLKVRFFWPFEGDYWVIELGEDYEYAVVSEPSRDSLWILSRTTTIDDAKMKDIMGRLQTKHGFTDLSRLKFTRVDE